MSLRNKGDGNFIPYLGKAKRKWKTYWDSGLILKDNVYYIENIIEPIGHMFNDENTKVYGVNVYEINDKRKKYLFSMNKNNIDKYFKPMIHETFCKSMKILFETYSGKKVNKKFETAKDAKEYLLRNKSFIKEARIMEGPLGSGGWTPKKAIGQFVKGRKKLNDKMDMD